jgi:hypothetical protein
LGLCQFVLLDCQPHFGRYATFDLRLDPLLQEFSPPVESRSTAFFCCPHEPFGLCARDGTASNIILYDGAEFSFQDLLLRPGMCLEITEVSFTHQRYGPILAVAWWHKDYAEPIYLVSNFDLKEEICYWYQKRFKIETFFSDQKSRGLHLHKSHLSDPSRLAKLMLAACLAYLWIIYIGLWSFGQNLHKLVHRTDRCDLSLFQLGLRILDHLLDFNMPIPVSFTDFSHAYPNFVR